MRKIRSMFFWALLFLTVSGCGTKEEDVVREPQWKKIEERLIEGQSFEVELDGWGKVFFAAAVPSEGGRDAAFYADQGE